MAILNSLRGNNSKDRELAEELRGVLKDMQAEREKFQALIEGSRDAVQHLEQLHEPIARAESEVTNVTSRLGDIQQRMDAVVVLAKDIQGLGDRVEGMSQSQHEAEGQLATVIQDSQRIRSVFEELAQKVDFAEGLRGRLEAFLEVEKPFQVLRADGDALRGQVEGTAEHMVRLREQHDRLVDAHKLGTSKMEALDRRREELSRDLQDKERRVIGVEQAVRGMDGIRQTVDEVRREIGTLKALVDSVGQKSSALEAQGAAVERALSQADSLEHAMRKIDVGIRQQIDNEKQLGAMQEQVAALRSLHEQVVERSSEISQLQHQTEEQTGVIRHEINAARDEMKNAVDRFDFESKGLEAVSQRVADLRGALSEFENRFKGLRESSQTVGELSAQTRSLTAQVQGLVDESSRIGDEVQKLQALRRDLDQAGSAVRDLGTQVARIEEGRPAVAAVLRDFEQLASTHALVTDSLEQAQVAQAEVARMQQAQAETRAWLANAEQSIAGLRGEVDAVNVLTPTLDVVQRQAQHITESLSSIEARRGFVDEIQQRFVELGATSNHLDERGRELKGRMEVAEERFQSLASQAEEAGRLATTIAAVTASVLEAARQSESISKDVAAIETRCKSVEGIAERTRAVRQELDQRQKALEEAAKKLQHSSKLRQEAAGSAQKLEELAKQLGESVTSAEERVEHIGSVSSKLEDRVAHLRQVDKRLGQFEERLAKWDLVDTEVSRSLEQIAARQDTVQTLQADLDRMFVTAEKTSADVRAITSAHREIAESRSLLDQVMARLEEIRDTVSDLDERKRQMTKAEERLARADGFLVDVRSSLEALQGQKVMVDQAVEKTGALRFLLKQAEAMIESLREERKMTADVRDAIEDSRDDDVENEGGMAKVA